MHLNEIVGHNIRLLRQDLGLSQKALAARVGSNPATISRLEAGKQPPDVNQLERLAEVFGVSARSLLNEIRIILSGVELQEGKR